MPGGRNVTAFHRRIVGTRHLQFGQCCNQGGNVFFGLDKGHAQRRVEMPFQDAFLTFKIVTKLARQPIAELLDRGRQMDEMAIAYAVKDMDEIVGLDHRRRNQIAPQEAVGADSIHLNGGHIAVKPRDHVEQKIVGLPGARHHGLAAQHAQSGEAEREECMVADGERNAEGDLLDRNDAGDGTSWRGADRQDGKLVPSFRGREIFKERGL